jgi:hypothetical protein
MNWSYHRIDREFTPNEAERITGVSTALQRDWRRRKIIAGKEDGRWTRWELDDLVRLTVMKLFSEAGMDVSKTGTVASMAMMPTFTAFAMFPEAYEIVCDDELTEEERATVLGWGAPRTTHPSHTVGRYLASFGTDEMQVCRTATLEQLGEFMTEQKQAVFAVVDCFQVAAQIVERADGPISRIELEAPE